MIYQTLKQTAATSSDSDSSSEGYATLFAGLADRNPNLFRRIGLPLGDPTAWIELPSGNKIRIVRDLEMDRTRAAGIEEGDDHAAIELGTVFCPADFPPTNGSLSADRETATAQAVAACLQKEGVRRVRADRTLPMIYVWHVAAAGIAIDYDDELGVIDRRVKTASEVAALRQAQHVTEQVMLQICRRIATASVDDDGHLIDESYLLTSERIRAFAARLFMDRGFTMSHGAIVAARPFSADCHHAGTGPLSTGVPIIVDLFPRDESTRYNGDCTRTVVHGTPNDEVVRMHAAVVASKAAGEAEMYPGRTADAVHKAVIRELEAAGYQSRRGELTDEASIQHGTGHGIGLDVHEPILLDDGGGELLEGEMFTVEPGLYGRRDGGVRVEDMVLVTENGPEIINELPMGLDWT
ncbi:M24 family metallopeptidase [Aporhodopirellula aestuarii]|uniref:M24 family metallopeptidase n=1 Tax=Aporhodopirellula aestuarii TaxID=2950107 RepID=A0ABT0TXN8_9BACT|nr:M24 family metallopeptidase [Aporhodopirellula aestuarii]MCM2369236.1 M24 family metallopeptidase [Aporhodopirellula aestuarii]